MQKTSTIKFSSFSFLSWFPRSLELNLVLNFILFYIIVGLDSKCSVLFVFFSFIL